MDWESGVLWGILGIISGIIISYVFYILSKKKLILSFSINTTSVVSNKINLIQGLSIKFNHKEIENLYLTVIELENVGNSIIEKDNFAPVKPLAIRTTGQFLVEHGAGINLYSDNDANNIFPLFEINEKDGTCSKIVISYDYIKKHEKIKCSFFHTNDSVSISGVLKDGKIYNKEIVNRKYVKFVNAIRYIIIILISVTISLLINTVTSN